MQVRIKQILWWGVLGSFGAVVCALAAGFGINRWITQTAQPQIFDTLEAIPENDVALVLGTSPTMGGGRWSNPFFEGRMDAAAALFLQGKVRHLLVSGDNGTRQYDEPTAMRDALISRGVPETAITLDYAGFRTLDSVVRAHTVFGVDRFTIVTDDFHVARALFLARANGLEAIAYQSAPVPWKWSKKTRLREIASRVKAWCDVYVLGTEPRFDGPAEPLRLARNR